MRITLAVAVACLTFGGLAAAGDATAAIRKSTDIPAQGLGPALTKLAKEFDFQVLYRTEIVSNLKSQPAVGALTSDEALGKVLTGTGLTYKYLDDKTVTIVPMSTAGSGQSTPSNTPGSPDGANTSKEAGKKSSQEFRLAQVDQGKDSSASSVKEQNSTSRENAKNPSAGLEEIVVTAQKREERLRDVPIPLAVIDTQALTSNNQTRLQDYYTQVPGLSIAPNIESGQLISIRGITTGGFGTPTVGVMVDDVPFGSSTNSNGNQVPDLDPGDLARMEVLRGPQGTLYGASSMGGLLKFVTNDPTTDRVSGHVDIGTDTIDNAEKLGYSFRGGINIPLNDVLAIRASGFVREEPGYLDNAILHTEGINAVHYEGGHLSALWTPSDTLSIKLSALYQKIAGDATDAQTSMEGNLERTDLTIPWIGRYEREVQAYSAILKWKIGTADLTSLTGYNVNSSSNSWDNPSSLSELFFKVSGNPEFVDSKTTKFSQELRLSVPFGQRVDWLIGGFYTHENTPFFYNLAAEELGTLQIVGSVLHNDNSASIYDEYAAFTDLTLRFTDRFDVQLGARQSRIDQSNEATTVSGPLEVLISGSPSATTPEAKSSAKPFTYLVTPRLKLSPDVMLYARAASGYRAGGPNASAAAFPGIPAGYQSDKAQDYEIGIKGTADDYSFSYDASLYYIEWKNIQLQLEGLVPVGATNVSVSYVGNAAAAKSEGVELSAKWVPIPGLHVAGWVTWNEAVLTENFPPGAVLAGVNGASGDRLPFSARFSGSLSLDDDFRLTDRLTAFAGASVSYVGDRLDVFTPSPIRQDLPAYAKTDLRTGVRYGTWNIRVYANNVTDKRGLISTQTLTSPQEFYFIQPRTIGLNISKAF